MIELIAKTKSRNSLYYGHWRYCGRFYLAHADLLRHHDHSVIDHLIQTRQRLHRQRVVNFGGSWRSTQEITDAAAQSVHAVCDFLSSDTVARKVMIFQNHIYVYTNDIVLYEKLAQIGDISLQEVTQVRLTGTPGSMMLKKTAHKMRSYFSCKRLNSKSAASVREFLINQKDVRTSPSLSQWISQGRLMMFRHFFLDHDHDSVVLMLGLISPGLIRKTVQIESAK